MLIEIFLFFQAVMAPKKIETGLVIIIDVGINTGTVSDVDKKTFLAEAREFAARLIERKIISQSTDYIGIVLLGCKETENNLNIQCGGGYRHIKIHEVLDSPTWKMIENLPQKVIFYKCTLIYSIGRNSIHKHSSTLCKFGPISSTCSLI